MGKDATYTRRINLYINDKEIKNDVKSIKTEMIKLTAAQSRMTIGSKEYAATGKKIQALNSILKKHRRELYQTDTAWQKLIKRMGGYKTMIIAGLGTALVSVFKKMTENSIKLEKALSSLSAITGATGEDLIYFREQALQTSKATLQSAEEVVKSYELVGSIRPELLKNKEALVEVTKQAIILNEATGGKLGMAEAAKATASALNQFNLESAEATKVINAFAAGSKEGAAAIPELTAAIDKFGAVAASSNVTLEQSLGLLETLAEKNIMGAEAGTKLRNILITLQSDQENYINGVFDLNHALERLSNTNMSITEMTKMFGKENVVAAKILTNNTKKYHDYTEAITGTNTALEQQAIQNDNVAAKWQNLMNILDNALTSPAFAGVLSSAIDGITKAISNLERSMMSAEDVSADYFSTVMKNINTAGSTEEKINRINKAIKTQQELAGQYKKDIEDLGWIYRAADKETLTKALESTTLNIQKLQKAMADIKDQQFVESFDFSKKSLEELLDLEGNYLQMEEWLTEKQKLKLQAIQKEIKLKQGLKEEEDSKTKAAKIEAQKKADEEAEKQRKKEEEELKKYQAEKIKAEKNLAEKIKEIRRQLNLEAMSEDAKEIQQIKNKYADLISVAEEYGIDTAQLVDLMNREIEAKEKEQADKRIKLRKETEQKIFEVTASMRDKAKSDIQKRYTELIQLAEKYGFDTTELYQKMMDELEIINETQFADEADIFGMTQDDWDKLIENINRALQYIDEIGMAWDAVNRILANKDEKDLQRYETNTKKKKEILNKQLKEGVISQEEYTASVAQLEADLDKKRAETAREQAKREKALAIFSTIINTSAAIVKMLADPGGFAGVALSIMAGITGALQVAAIASKPLPQYAVGGYTDGARVYIAGEKGTEWIASNNMVTDPYTGPVIAALEAIRTGSAPASVFGGVTPAFATMQNSVPAFAEGGYTAASGANTTNNYYQNNMSNELLTAIIERQDILIAYLADPNNRRAYITHDDLSRTSSEDEEREAARTIK